MAWKGVHLTKAARLSLADRQIVVAQDDGEVRMPLEDVAWIVLDSPQATLTSTLASACMGSGIVIVHCDARHLPCGLTLPFHSHFNQGGVARAQIAIGEGLRNRIWQGMVRAKLLNQGAVLARCAQPKADAEAAEATLGAMARLVAPGDPDNVEARAARFYWSHLFSDFIRDRPQDRRNMLLNYGYAVMRGAIARGLAAHGLLPAFGIHHDSAANPFNLADDLMEPFRPFVDLLAFETSGGLAARDDDLSLADRRAMAGILLRNALLGKERVSLLAAAELTAEGLARAFEKGTSALLSLPRLERKCES